MGNAPPSKPETKKKTDNEKSSDSIKIPAVKVLSAVQGDSIDTLNVSLPEGIKITGGVKLRDAGYTGKGVKVAVIDSGVDKDHPGFNGKVVKQEWYRFGTPLSRDYHGTHVAGTIHLMAPDAEIYDYRVFGSRGDYSIDQAIVLAIDQARLDGCDVINMSLGGPVPFPPIRAAIKRAYDAGMIIVCAAGNEGDDNPLTNELSWPAAYEECISVAAVQKRNGLPVATFSSSNAAVDYSGIGVNVLSLKPGGDVMRLSGTSMACPHVAGFVACLLSKSRATERPDDEIVTSDPDTGGFCGCCGGGGSAAAAVSDTVPPPVPKSVFGIEGDAALRKVVNEKFLVDIGITGPDNETGLGFLTYLSKDELMKLF